MTIAGWLLMAVSCGSITALTVFCYVRLLRGPGADRATRR
jgi:hypothetical protein